jgi:hypothetical protein
MDSVARLKLGRVGQIALAHGQIRMDSGRILLLLVRLFEGYSSS